jgi:hypothetical protein
MDGYTMRGWVKCSIMRVKGIRYYESPAWGEWCRRVYGIDLKQSKPLFLGKIGLVSPFWKDDNFY